MTAIPPSIARRSLLLDRFIVKFTGYLILSFATIASLYPVVMMVINSFKIRSEIFNNPAGFPRDWTLYNYNNIANFHSGLMQNFLNSVVISVTSSFIAVFLCSLGAYAFSKYQFKGRDLLFALLLGTMMIPSEILIPGQYIMFAKIGWLNTLRVQILPGAISVFGLFFIRQYMLSIPNEMIEAAWVDGAGHFTTFWNIMLPASAPALGAFAIMHFMGMWNNYLWPMMVATKKEFQPIVVVLPQLVDTQIGFVPEWGLIMAGAVLSTLPIIVIFLIFQDTFLKSVVIGAVKG
ncbi:ABC-type sugar transport system, permease component [Anaerolinea thermolimosa]|uniref:carbohydrate ABC transporter permease n=1 Tax=Anaerolinea thermolimosa TaxID=229919 RepID=UPI0013B3957E|nr:carbohydrate ABC transporter permease [Anaerolinea thermolimosa]GAP05191.1 ABC-type sugar transport system, permease component [Anaerolinea thermolimosa]